MNHLPPRDVTGHVSGRSRDRFRQVRFRRFRPRSNRRLGGRPRFREHALGFRRDRLRELPIEALVVLESEDDEPKRVIFVQTQLRLNSPQLVALAFGRGAPQHPLEARQRRGRLIHY